MLNSSKQTVEIKVPLASFGKTMSQCRSWLDGRKVQPTNFQTRIVGDGYALIIAFRQEDDAELFRRDFAARRVADEPASITL